MSLETNSCERQDACVRPDQCHSSITSRLHGEINKTILQSGQGFQKPQWGSLCVVDIFVDKDNVPTENGTDFGSDQLHEGGKNIEVDLGQSESEFTMKVETCLLTMCEGEVSKFVFYQSGVGSFLKSESIETPLGEQNENLSVVNKSTCLTISLHRFSQAPPCWKLSSEEKYNLALSHKTKGTELFQSGKVDAAFIRYSRAAKYLICIPELSTVADAGFSEMDSECKISLKDLRTLQCICHLNLAACQAKVSNHRGVVDNCTRVLALDADSVKALYRRAVANMACGHKDKARDDLLRAKKLEPQNKAVAHLLQICQL
ncbi:peptidyl-prolyl cis-trans isomerase FKBP4 [Elysia marginata]|uniref:Peptidyl-prolyl cis-trans isomerase FKBP4 n=1 Tax=Elysia marginata TaxID=1093978 RepID=A0AAV4HT86_9GAST|nr:peptidyl-prolyl cis-trans isomerase FKBP4 [Elysia marginata]